MTYLDIVYIVHNKNYLAKKIRMTYDLKQRKYLLTLSECFKIIFLNEDPFYKTAVPLAGLSRRPPARARRP